MLCRKHTKTKDFKRIVNVVESRKLNDKKEQLYIGYFKL